jgi:hypothetical protein
MLNPMHLLILCYVGVARVDPRHLPILRYIRAARVDPRPANSEVHKSCKS